MNTRFFALVATVCGLSLSACTITSDTSGEGGGGNGGTATTSSAGSAGGSGGAATTSSTGGGGGSGGAAACGNCFDMIDATSSVTEICENDTAAIDAYDAFVTCTCDAAGCADKCGDNACDGKDMEQACEDCILDQSGPCGTQLSNCYKN